ncbi:MAG: hypothetical protein AAF772_18350, partial [Acidobacteriota bacterium]
DPVNQVIDLSDLENGHLRSGFTLSGDDPLPSNFWTPQGRAVSLVPLGTDSDAVLPPLSAGGFAWASRSSRDTPIGTGEVYLAPNANHGVVVDEADPATEQALMGGLFGSEQLSVRTYRAADGVDGNDRLYFLASQPGFAPIFPFETATLDEPTSGGVRPRLTDDYRTSWATILAGPSRAIVYRAEPEGSALYGVDAATRARLGDDLRGRSDDGTPIVLGSTPPKMDTAQGTPYVYPLLPYGAAAQAGVDGDTLTQFESQIVAPTRKQTISSQAQATWAARAAARNRHRALRASGAAQAIADATAYGTTPQGFVVELDGDSSDYQNVRLAQSTNTRAQRAACDPGGPPPPLLPFAFDQPTRDLQDALQTNQLFLVAVNPAPFKADGACFDNVVNLVDWTMTANVGANSTATAYRNIMILKFCSGSLQERISNPNRWTAPEAFSLLPGTPPATAALTYTGLSQQLQQIVSDGIARADGRSAIFYQNFKRIVTDPDWQGVIVLSADLSADDLPPEIAGLAAGIDFTRFAAHHFGFTVTDVSADASGVITMGDGESSLFGLIDYEDPAYASNLAQGVSPDTPIAVDSTGAFDFTVLQLQSLFDNARLVEFQSRIQLTARELFGAPVSAVYTRGQIQPAPGLVLDGSHIEQGGKSTYVFAMDTASVLASPSNVLPAVAFDRVQFNTLGTRADGETVASRFSIWGTFDFVELQDATGLLDVLSFGSAPGTPAAQLGTGLAFSNLLLDMQFLQSTPSAKRFALDTDNLAWDLNASTARDDSLFAGFGLELKGFASAAGDTTPADLGFLPITSTLQLEKLETPWFGVVYDITLGGPGALATAAGFSSRLLVAWAPTTQGGDTRRAVFLGMTLPGAAPNAQLFSLQGIFKVSVGAISILRQPVPQAPGRSAAADESFYCLRIDDIGIKIFSIAKLPPSATIQFFLFGDPQRTGSLGWYAAYVADDNPGCGQQLAFAEADVIADPLGAPRALPTPPGPGSANAQETTP